MRFTIDTYRVEDLDKVAHLITGIQQREFGIPITLDDQPDLADIPAFYQSGAGGFWVARSGQGVIGTIGLKDIGDRAAALRKMFVAKEARGQAGVANALLEEAFRHVRSHGLTAVYLGTTDRFHAAHRFYEKHGFAKIDADRLPEAFPRMAVDRVFYKRDF